MNQSEYDDAVLDVERALAKNNHSRDEILAVLIRVTVNAIHVIEQRDLRERVELQYVRMLMRRSAMEEERQQFAVNERPPTYPDKFVAALVDQFYREVGCSNGHHYALPPLRRRMVAKTPRSGPRATGKRRL